MRNGVAKTIEGHALSVNYLMADSSIKREIFAEELTPLPAFAVFDASGKLVYTMVGSIDVPENRQKLRDALDAVAAKK